MAGFKMFKVVLSGLVGYQQGFYCFEDRAGNRVLKAENSLTTMAY